MSVWGLYKFALLLRLVTWPLPALGSRVVGTFLAVATILALVIQFSVQKFVVDAEPWSHTYIQKYIDSVVIGVTVLVVAIPEGLPLAVTIALAYSVKVSGFHRANCKTVK